jgi:hypothetical protein
MQARSVVVNSGSLIKLKGSGTIGIIVGTRDMTTLELIQGAEGPVYLAHVNGSCCSLIREAFSVLEASDRST